MSNLKFYFFYSLFHYFKELKQQFGFILILIVIISTNVTFPFLGSILLLYNQLIRDNKKRMIFV